MDWKLKSTPIWPQNELSSPSRSGNTSPIVYNRQKLCGFFLTNAGVWWGCCWLSFMHICGGIDNGYKCAILKHEVGIARLPKMAPRWGGVSGHCLIWDSGMLPLKLRHVLGRLAFSETCFAKICTRSNNVLKIRWEIHFLIYFFKILTKTPVNRRQSISQPMRIVAPIPKKSC